MKISIVVPCYNEEDVLHLFKTETDKVLKELCNEKGCTYEYIFVDDGSKDQTLSILKEFHQKDRNAHFISFSRNFGKEAALYAGLQASTGDYTAVMDADLQDPPSLLNEMLACVESGEYDCAAARREDRKGEPKLRSFFARQFYKIVNRGSDTEIVDGARDFRLMNRKMLNAVLEMSEYNRFSKGIFSWVGFKTKWISFHNVERAAGKTKWNFFSLARYAVEGIVGYTTRPLEIAAYAGILFFLLSIVGIIFIVVRKLIFDDPVQGWASLVVIILFTSGIQLFCTGVIGEYLAKTYLEVKHRPVYIVKETDQD